VLTTTSRTVQVWYFVGASVPEYFFAVVRSIIRLCESLGARAYWSAWHDMPVLFPSAPYAERAAHIFWESAKSGPSHVLPATRLTESRRRIAKGKEPVPVKAESRHKHLGRWHSSPKNREVTDWLRKRGSSPTNQHGWTKPPTTNGFDHDWLLRFLTG
jgi:hypothetical protein